MKKPRMILFDYGHTLLYEPEFDFLKGEKAVFKHIKDNPLNVTPEEVYTFGIQLYEEFKGCRKLGYELHEWQMLKCKYDRFGISFTIPLEEVENILWTNTSPGGRMPYVEEMLCFIHAEGIRTGVISNITWSGKALTERINRMLPENHFEFILTSSDYCIRKPNPLLFHIALQKAGLDASQVWYCGDNIKTDIYGAHDVGIFPVLYEGEMQENNPYANQNDGLAINFEHLHIRHWGELMKTLEKL